MLGGDRPMRVALWSGAVSMLLGPACVSHDVDPTPPEPLQQSSIVIALPLGGDEPGDAYYRSILAQMHEAYLERNQELLATLLARYDDPRAPEWATEILPRYRSLVTALAFELHAQQQSEVQVAEAPIGEPLEFLLRLPSRPGMSVMLGAGASSRPVSFRVTFDVADQDSRGDVLRREFGSVLQLSDDLLLTDGVSLEIPFTLELPAGSALIRNVTVRVELMPGYVQVNGDEVPHNRVTCSGAELVLYPVGIESIRRAPRVTLLRAMELGDVDHFGHIFLAANFMSEQYKEEAMTGLMRWIRLGNEDQQQVAMAAIAVLSDADIAVGDRRGWLEWWQHRKAG